jgi:hypothetical protein
MTVNKALKHKPIWVDVASGRTASSAAPGYTRFDSLLEYHVSLELDKQGIAYRTQYKIQLIPPNCGVSQAYNWTADFWLTDLRIPLEVKGKWILLRARAADKKLFALQWALTKIQFPGATLVSSEAFQIDDFNVHEYRSYLAWLVQ